MHAANKTTRLGVRGGDWGVAFLADEIDHDKNWGLEESELRLFTNFGVETIASEDVFAGSFFLKIDEFIESADIAVAIDESVLGAVVTLIGDLGLEFFFAIFHCVGAGW